MGLDQAEPVASGPAQRIKKILILVVTVLNMLDAEFRAIHGIV